MSVNSIIIKFKKYFKPNDSLKKNRIFSRLKSVSSKFYFFDNRLSLIYKMQVCRLYESTGYASSSGFPDPPLQSRKGN